LFTTIYFQYSQFSLRTGTTGKDNPVLAEAVWVAFDCISPFTIGKEFHQRYNPGKPISLDA